MLHYHMTTLSLATGEPPEYSFVRALAKNRNIRSSC